MRRGKDEQEEGQHDDRNRAEPPRFISFFFFKYLSCIMYLGTTPRED